MITSSNQDNKPSPEDKPETKKSIFDVNKELGISKSQMRSEFKKTRDKTTAWGSHIMSPGEKSRLPEELFSSYKYGSYVSKKEVDDKITKLNQYLGLAKRQGNRFQASKIQDQIDFLKQLKEK